MGDGVTAWNSLDYVTYGPAPGGGAVDSVNGQTGTVVLDAGDVGADPAGSAAAAQSAAETYADGKVADAINDGTTTIAPSQNAVFDALALKQNKTVIFKSTTDVPHTGTNTETVKISIPIPANTFAAGDVVRVRIRTRKSGTAGNLNVRLRHGTNNSTADALVQNILAASTLLYQQFSLHLVFKTTTTIEVVANSATNYTDDTNSGNAVATITTDTTAATYYFVITYQLGNSADTANGSFYLFEKL